ncbi:ribosome biogenesis protein Nop53/GLTSCR2 [Crassisporium funariophilum]|nr:ribosome biogenesis protein Nop53/GLTSCR2 [Crassisporium funariophilum]
MATSKTPKTKSVDSKPQKSSRSTLGAPSQHNQTSRRGKRAWRKNVNIEDVEEGLEGMRGEERVTGTILQKTQDNDLFQIDVKGDDKIRHTLPRYSAAQLTSTKILAQRSAVPAIFSRPSTAVVSKRKPGLSNDEKDRLMRIAKRPRKGPFNSVLDPSEYEAGTGIVELSEAVKSSGKYDAWAPEPEMEELQDGMETVQIKKFKPPVFTGPRDLIDVPAIVEPHQGTSYNPPVDAHQELLFQAAAIEEKRMKDLERMAVTKTKMSSAVEEPEDYDMSVAPGMKVQVSVEEDADEDQELEETIESTKNPERKTKSQRNKAARVLKERRALAERVEQKRMLASISGAKQLRRTNAQVTAAREKEREERRAALAEKMKKQGLVGQKLGRHKVPEGELVVQVGEDLSESLRGLKPEGNLFRDRFQSLQQRALIEPRKLVLPKKRRNRIIEYEKHAWKRFE